MKCNRLCVSLGVSRWRSRERKNNDSTVHRPKPRKFSPNAPRGLFEAWFRQDCARFPHQRRERRRRRDAALFFLSKEARSTGLTFNTDFAYTESTQPNVCAPRNVGFRCATRLVREHSPHHDKPLSEEVRKSTSRYRALPRPSNSG